MQVITIILVILGLSLFEIISSVDNAIINAEVLSKMGEKSKRWFLFWGLLFAVLVVRGILPLIIVWLVAKVSLWQALTGSLSGNEQIANGIDASAPILLMGGGVFLIFLFFNWLFLEPKNFGIPGEKFILSQGVWFYAVVSIFLAAIVWNSLNVNPILAFSAVVGSTAFFISSGFKEHAEMVERDLLNKSMSDVSKILYLEIIDATFSIDGVLGAFAFTLSIPLILLGNGLGALVLRRLTISNIETIKKYQFLKNGAMYSVFFLGTIMILDSLGARIPEWISPLITFFIVGYFYIKSRRSIIKDMAEI